MFLYNFLKIDKKKCQICFIIPTFYDMLIRKKPDLHIHRSLKMVSTYTVIYPLIDFLDILWTTHLQPVNNTFIVQYFYWFPTFFYLKYYLRSVYWFLPKWLHSHHQAHSHLKRNRVPCFMHYVSIIQHIFILSYHINFIFCILSD